eukprot:gb/GFBE01061008.1/.p1 GENE.gb/GFBE01061008.1/~~gb/GFBE01061008.1/.p1  ORF type:complete len:290 (+),score=44.85 gb/GFBE01061008.1/:1-870(+)
MAEAEQEHEQEASIQGSVDMAQTAPSGWGDYGDLSSSTRRKRKPGAKWDGRVSSLTLQEYREMKWGLDAGYRAALRGGPKYTMRPALSKPLRTNSDGCLDTDVCKAFDACHSTGPKFTMGLSLSFQNTNSDRAPGPHYAVPSSMDPNGHPTIPKNTGAKFGSETLQVLDEDAPAPGQYDQMTYKLSGRVKRMPSWTCAGREAWREPTTAPGPAPGEYKYENAVRTGKLTPLRWNMQGKTEPIVPARGDRACIKPGPGHYKIPSIGEKNAYPEKSKPPIWKFSSDARGLL